MVESSERRQVFFWRWPFPASRGRRKKLYHLEYDRVDLGLCQLGPELLAKCQTLHGVQVLRALYTSACSMPRVIPHILEILHSYFWNDRGISRDLVRFRKRYIVYRYLATEAREWALLTAFVRPGRNIFARRPQHGHWKSVDSCPEHSDSDFRVWSMAKTSRWTV